VLLDPGRGYHVVPPGQERDLLPAASDKRAGPAISKRATLQIFDSETTAAHLPFDKLIAAIEQIFIDGCTVPKRGNHRLNPDATNDSLLIMPAWQPGGYLGIKHVTIFPGNTARGLPGLHSTYALYDGNNGVPLAMVDGDQITIRRTAAASALAARFLARQDASRLLIVGAGRVAAALAPAYAAVRGLSEVTVWNHDGKKSAALARQLADAGYHARQAPDLESAVREADMISCATLSERPLIQRDWLAPGAHLDLIGSFQPFMREADDATFAGTSVFVDTLEALEKSGDLLSPMAAGVFKAQDVRATLEGLCRRQHPGRTAQEEITVYKAVGIASEDLAAAVLVYRSAR
jgi:ornithine cyclodeaminase/alanine dehydrogenase-like protein (mu-crystallin family)